MLCYINKMYQVDGKDVGLELVQQCKEFGDVTYKVMTIDEIKQEYQTFIGKGYNLDFRVADSGVYPFGHVETLHVPNKSLIPLGERTLDKVLSIYDLFILLIEKDGIYLSDEITGLESYKGFLNSFRNIRVSQSTMSVNISIQNDEGFWRTRSLLKCVNDKMEQSQFTFAIPKKYSDEMCNFECDKIKDMIINNTEYTVYNYDKQLPICNSLSDFTLPNPLIAHYTYLSYAYKNLLNTFKSFLIRHEVYGVEQSEKKEEYNKPTSSTTYTGVYFKSDLKDLSKVDRENLITLFEASISMYTKEQILTIDLNPVLQKYRLAPICKFIFKNLLNNISYDSITESIALESFDNVSSMMNTLTRKYLENEFFLYNARVSCMYNPRIINSLASSTRKYVKGSMYNSTVTIMKR